MELLDKRRKIREKVIEDARKWANSLPFKSTVILIGSYARGDFNLWSDVDVIVVSEIKGTPVERLMKIDVPPGYDVIPLTLGEFLRLLKRKDPLALEAIAHGIILRDDYNILHIVQHQE